LFIGQIHYSLLVSEKNKQTIDYSTSITSINEVFNDNYFKNISLFLTNNRILTSNINILKDSFYNKYIYYNRFTAFVVFQIILNIKRHTKPQDYENAKISIYCEKDCVVVKNSFSTITKQKLNLILQNLAVDKPPFDSISLYVINKFCNDMCINPRSHNSILLTIEKEDTFVLKLPIIVTS
jgi:hypothetical protein